MTSGRRLPRLFVGSSTEGLGVAYAIQENLEFDAEVTVWAQGIFRPSHATLHDLMLAIGQFDFAAFAFTPDDIAAVRGHEAPRVRDNVIFELGLFYGRLGLERCFFVLPRDESELRLPTDLLGVAPLTYRSGRSDANLVAALGTACNQVRRAFHRVPAPTPTGSERASTFSPAELREYVDRWNSSALEASRSRIRSVALDHYSDEAQSQRPHIQHVFAFLEGLSAAILAGEIRESAAAAVFGEAVVSFWPVAASLLAPPNLVDEWWDPPPAIATVYGRWARKQKGSA